jgi:hypothetical protein
MYDVCVSDLKEYSKTVGFLFFLAILYGFVKLQGGIVPPIRSPYFYEFMFEEDFDQEPSEGSTYSLRNKRLLRRSERIKNGKVKRGTSHFVYPK